MSNVQISNPCTEDWNKMTPEAKGKFCSKCTKVVHDFRQSTHEEIARFMTSSKEKSCGRFYKHQLADIKQQREWRLFCRFAFAILIAFGSTLFTVNTSLAQSKIDAWKHAFSIEKNGVQEKYDYTLKGVALDGHSKKPVGFAKVSYYKKDGTHAEVVANEKGEFVMNLNKEDIISAKQMILYASTGDDWYFGSSAYLNLEKELPDVIEINMFYEEIMGDMIDPEWEEQQLNK